MSASRNLPIPFVNGDEEDFLTGAKRYFAEIPGRRKLVKRAYWRRFCHGEKSAIEQELTAEAIAAKIAERNEVGKFVGKMEKELN